MTATLKIIDSWRSLKTWVKLWLVWLNIVLLAAAFFLDDPVALWTLASLPVSFAILVWIAVRRGGLVRILGVGHLVPWLPLITYLEMRLLGEWAGPRIAYEINEVSLRQSITSNKMLGRVNASLRVIALGSMFIGSLMAGALGEAIGLRATLAIAAGFGMLAWLGLRISSLRTLKYQPEPPDDIS